jgi:nucleoside-diphosphate-sugar epimerase
LKALVTGGGGFLGRSIVSQLLARGDSVTVLARSRYPEVEALGATGVQWDLTQLEGLAEIVSGHDVVLHVASMVGPWGKRQDFLDVNVGGTKNLIAACRQAGVTRLVYTSSPSATFGPRPAEGATETECPYPAEFGGPYPESKALAEQEVLAANGPELATTALRPHLIYGPGEPHMLPRILARQTQGRLKRIGDGQNTVSLTFRDNAAAAHLQAADALTPGSSNAGKAYFINDPEPVLLWEWIDRFLTGVGAGPVKGQVGLKLAMRVGSLMEWIWRIFSLKGEPLMTRFGAFGLGTSHWYRCTAAEQDFGFRCLVSGEQGLQATIAGFLSDAPESRSDSN